MLKRWAWCSVAFVFAAIALGVPRGKDEPKDFEGSVGGWGYSESPLVDGKKLIVTPGGKKATLVALDKTNGETIWTAQVPEGDQAQYSSVIAANLGNPGIHPVHEP